ncbi:hypothetical protein CO083_04745 [Candidatus Roizmanbacteria bacterium CG_4_9_14_0_8_um_filter_34_12]|uniref:Uncharacterized protein n=5 Tax=Candidatus Roizmaniibacteriota TaxID=1752723 RepID=A0A2M7E3Q0_9BACT|nr:MAG: hypothetical protein COW96_05005 [Candidatus Roizmanbacteria bacterium CG22_combo_CG10-13_8_21_14_all_33_16]PIV62354.1 MAG: hypothetical protein COS12_02705 [Candidatus Roizmanbacteria bacterium CG01_land_8_20_14_3_00_33_9]PIX69559.1 MAG: hypothetical protein COZ39_05255 [Candidatus Roizmanbacteria bacterium CG_4_10_14_3_um_filter_33_21]PJB87867.1 MAG: hypothetical protein CO083_04745 [Candidatus Roizmanbacteria bacterium CG_4_9_14_0_8_um_filter_34_12]PJC30661.1 MAG: hypothetical protei
MNSNIQIIADKGSKIYQKIKSRYEPKENGKFLAIDVESENAYLANTSADALVLAKKGHSDKIFYVVKIGFDTAETIAKSFGILIK